MHSIFCAPPPLSSSFSTAFVFLRPAHPRLCRRLFFGAGGLHGLSFSTCFCRTLSCIFRSLALCVGLLGQFWPACLRRPSRPGQVREERAGFRVARWACAGTRAQPRAGPAGSRRGPPQTGARGTRIAKSVIRAIGRSAGSSGEGQAPRASAEATRAPAEVTRTSAIAPSSPGHRRCPTQTGPASLHTISVPAALC